MIPAETPEGTRVTVIAGNYPGKVGTLGRVDAKAGTAVVVLDAWAPSGSPGSLGGATAVQLADLQLA